MPNNNIKKVYDAMSAKYNMEEPYEVFEKNMTDGANRKAVYDALTQKYNMLDSFEDFSDTLLYKEYLRLIRMMQTAMPEYIHNLLH